MLFQKHMLQKHWQDKSQIKKKINLMKKMYIFQQKGCFCNQS